MAHEIQSPTRRRAVGGGYRLFSALGVDIVADWSLLIIFGLIVFGLGGSAFPSWHPQWSPVLYWTLAVIAGIGLIASIAVHELAHAWVANRRGVPVRRITLFVFGGVAQMQGRPQSPGDELKIAGAGPLVSLALGLVLLVLGVALAQPSLRGADDPAAIASRIGPTATVLLWLGPINILLAVFNLLPGFPLDGGRVLRAGLWHATGDLRRATRWASGAGRGLAWMLMAVGVAMLFGVYLPVLGGGLINGLWLLLIGWFLNNAARLSYQQLIVKDALDDIAVGDLVRARPEPRVSPHTTVAALVRGPGMISDSPVIPVVEGERLLGVVDLSRLEHIDKRRWETIAVGEIMTPVRELVTLRPSDPAVDALDTLAMQSPVPVIEGDDRLVGLLRARDVARWLSFHSDVTIGRRFAE